MVTCGCSLRNAATISPLRLAAPMRRDRVSRERPSIQQEWGSSSSRWPSAGGARLLMWRGRAERRAGDEVGMPADILGQRVDRDVGAMAQGLLVEGPQQRVVAYDDGPVSPCGLDLVRDRLHQVDVDEGVHGIRRGFDHDDADAALVHRPACGRPHGLASKPSGKPSEWMLMFARVLAMRVSVPP